LGFAGVEGLGLKAMDAPSRNLTVLYFALRYVLYYVVYYSTEY
jgi:hypothetical protein